MIRVNTALKCTVSIAQCTPGPRDDSECRAEGDCAIYRRRKIQQVVSTLVPALNTMNLRDVKHIKYSKQDRQVQTHTYFACDGLPQV